ncbi:MAG TPA: TfoX/Sxy family protein [Stellaceae bacterium]|jgi:hypothetical protein|nr:TfoX/Sxy family protein [Stellaceae bacterium]
MRGEPSPPELIERLARLAPTVAGIDQRKMFGYPALFFNGNMLAGLFGYGVVLRLPQPERHALIAAGQAVPFVVIADNVLGELLEAARLHIAASHLKPRKLLANSPTNLEGIQC